MPFDGIPSERNDALRILSIGRALINDGWTQRHWMSSVYDLNLRRHRPRYCALGALRQAWNKHYNTPCTINDPIHPADDFALEHLYPMIPLYTRLRIVLYGGNPLIRYNDSVFCTKQEILSLFDRAIAIEENATVLALAACP